MKNFFLIALMGFVMIGCASHPTPSLAGKSASLGSNTTVLIMAEDWEDGTIPRHTQVFERVIDALTNQLQQNGFDVVDEIMATGRTHMQRRLERKPEELFQIAKAIKTPPIDAVMVFKIYPEFSADTTTTWMNAVITGKLLSVTGNKSLGNFEVTLPEEVATEYNCNKTKKCRLKYMGRIARKLGQQLGAAVSIKLKRASVTRGLGKSSTANENNGTGFPKGFQLTFDNFNSKEYNKIEKYLKTFTGYQKIRLVQSTSINHVVWYTTTTEDAKLKHNLRLMLEFMGVDAQVSCVNNTCQVTKI
jgi:hypothetical protein